MEISRDMGADDVKAGYGTMSVVDGVTYYHAVACDGWPTGPCRTPEKALERVRAYERCEEVSEAAPSQLSRAQMQAFLAWAVSPPHHGFGVAMRIVDDCEAIRLAIKDGLHSPAWIRVSQRSIILLTAKVLPRSILDAGGTLVRRRLPDTTIPTRGA